MNNKKIGIGIGVIALLFFAKNSKGQNTPSGGDGLPTGGNGNGSGNCMKALAANWSDYGQYLGSNGSQNESYLGLSLPNERGIRNNNPGNIKTYCCGDNYNYWLGELICEDNTDGVFAQFTYFPYGLRAMIKLLKNYKTNHAIDTIDKLIGRWDVPTASHYMDFVSQQTGIPRNQIIDLHDKPTLRKIVKAMVKLENSGFSVSDDQFNTAYALLS